MESTSIAQFWKSFDTNSLQIVASGTQEGGLYRLKSSHSLLEKSKSHLLNILKGRHAMVAQEEPCCGMLGLVILTTILFKNFPLHS